MDTFYVHIWSMYTIYVCIHFIYTFCHILTHLSHFVAFVTFFTFCQFCHILSHYVTFCMLHDKLRMSRVIYKMLMVILGTCWTTFVLMSLLKSEYLKLCHMPHVACHMSHCACHLSYVKCLCWSLGHAEQLLFSCLYSKVSICNYVTCHISHVTSNMSHCTCHMSYVKCLCWFLGHAEQLLFSCLGSKVTVYSRKLQWFFGDIISLITLPCEFRCHRAGSQLKTTLLGNQNFRHFLFRNNESVTSLTLATSFGFSKVKVF